MAATYVPRPRSCTTRASATPFIKPRLSAETRSASAMPGMPQLGAFYSFIVPSAASGGASSSLAARAPWQTPNCPTRRSSTQDASSSRASTTCSTRSTASSATPCRTRGLTTAAQIIPLLALQSKVNVPSGFATNLPVALFAPTTLSAMGGGTATFNGSLLGLGNTLTLGGGTMAFNGSVNLGSGNLIVQQGTASINAGLSASLVTVAAQGVLNNGRHQHDHGQRQLMPARPTTTASSAAMSATPACSPISAQSPATVSNAGTATNNGVIAGNVTNSGTLSGIGSDRRQPRPAAASSRRATRSAR